METRSWKKELAHDLSAIPQWRSAVVWPLDLGHPTTPEGRAAFFETLYHADAVVGLNTSAMIEAAILGKPVLTFLEHDVAASQTGNLHFQYLADGGFLLQARDMAEHLQQLSAALETPDANAENCERFVADFVRPLGRGVAASASLVALILRDMGIAVEAGGESTEREMSSITGT
jgi:hypothetical protein